MVCVALLRRSFWEGRWSGVDRRVCVAVMGFDVWFMSKGRVELSACDDELRTCHVGFKVDCAVEMGRGRWGRTDGKVCVGVIG